MSEPLYRLERGHYAFYIGEQRLFETEEVAILFDARDNVLLKHGLPDVVQASYTQMIDTLTAQGQTAFAHDLVVIQGRFALEDLNKTVSICDYIGRLYKKLLATSTE